MSYTELRHCPGTFCQRDKWTRGKCVDGCCGKSNTGRTSRRASVSPCCFCRRGRINPAVSALLSAPALPDPRASARASNPPNKYWRRRVSVAHARQTGGGLLVASSFSLIAITVARHDMTLTAPHGQASAAQFTVLRGPFNHNVTEPARLQSLRRASYMASAKRQPITSVTNGASSEVQRQTPWSGRTSCSRKAESFLKADPNGRICPLSAFYSKRFRIKSTQTDQTDRVTILANRSRYRNP